MMPQLLFLLVIVVIALILSVLKQVLLLKLFGVALAASAFILACYNVFSTWWRER